VDHRDDELAAIAARTQDIYERNAARFDAERNTRLGEQTWLERFCGLVPPGGAILDLGCGAGEPIARYLLQRGFLVSGVDFSEPMLAMARQRFPSARWQHADMRTLALGETFDGIVGWHSFFHLRPNEQRNTLRRLAQHLRPSGALMLTVGPQAGEVLGQVGEDAVYHSSLAPAEYAAILDILGFEIVAFVAQDPACGGSTVLLARLRAD
jgi:SAM-dependent methyltransferase